MSVKSVIRSTGEKIVDDDTKHVFVQGAYNLGPIIEHKEIATAGIHPGEGVDNAAGAAGEDTIVLMLDKSLNPLGVLEIDFGMVKDCSVDYAVSDDVPVIVFHFNPGALCRNIAIIDPSTHIKANQGLTSSSGTAGHFADYVECDVVVEDATKFCFANTAAGVNGASGTMLYTRIYMRSKYYVTDPTGVSTVVAYVSK